MEIKPDIIKYLKDIINNKTIKPTINNEKSNFVVVTYWWGNKIPNQNTSRPCISFFEKLNNDVQKLCLKILGTVPSTKGTSQSMKSQKNLTIQNIYGNLEKSIVNLDAFKTIINKTATSYNEMVFEQLGIERETDRENKSIMKLEKMKTRAQTPMDFEYKSKQSAADMFTLIMLEAITLIKKNILLIFDTNKKITELREKFLSNKETVTPALKNKIMKEINDLNKILTEQKAQIKKILNTKQPYTNEKMKEFSNMSIYEILHKEFRFLSPMTYDKMIDKWEQECAKFKCNHMAVEYPEFTKPGGYQLAINAKPLFIQKALESCGHRSVLYIDGDMFIRKYPHLFDLQDVDFMARGWLIDPRSSWKMEESITYDPYTFETSGGTMFFSQSMEAKQLINKWVEISGKSYQIGKADDRILSLVFNTYKFLCAMKIIQLPIEYLWLTLDYDERMLDAIYDGDKYAMAQSILIEHSECLTSEDTATGSGAASDRTPKFYGYLEENVEPVSEQFHEYIMFPSLAMVDTFKPYLTYMSNVQYMNDGNDILVKKGFVNLKNPEENEQPLYITEYKDKFGSIKYPQDNSLTYNKVAEINLTRATKMNTKDIGLVERDNDTIEINDFEKLMKEDAPEKYNHAKIISLIIKLLQSGKTVIYNPTTMVGYNELYYEILVEKKDSNYATMELIFVPEFTKGQTISANYFYKPKIQTNQAMLFKPSDILIKFLMMFLSLDDLSAYLNNGSYEFMSRIRVGYLIKPHGKNTSIKGTLGAKIIGSNIKESEYGTISVAAMGTASGTRPSPGTRSDSNKTLTPSSDSNKTLTPLSEQKREMSGGQNDADFTLYEEGLYILYNDVVGGSLKKHTRRKRNVKKRTVRKGKRMHGKTRYNKTIKKYRR
jgi:hypothetical protein